MSGFFHRFEQPEPVAEDEVDEDYEQPEWVGHPHAVVPGRSNQVATLFRGEAATLVLCCIDAYPIGLELNLRLLTATTERDHMPFDFDGARYTPRSVRFGVEFSDGRSWSNLSPSAPYPISSEREDIVVMHQGGGGGGRFWEFRFWLWPLPPEGPLTFYADWPAKSIPETSTVLDAAELRALAQSAVRIELPPAPSTIRP